MRTRNASSWQIAADFPEELQFAGYIPQQVDFRLGEVGTAHSQAENAWRAWWQGLINSRVDVYAAVRNLVDPRPFRKYDPPNFDSLANESELQTLCRQHWPEFDQQWGLVGGKKLPTVNQMTKQINQIRLDKIVKDCMRTMGKTQCNPFRLHVDFMLWPDNYHNQVSNQHIVLGAQFIKPQYAGELTSILKTMICLLV